MKKNPIKEIFEEFPEIQSFQIFQASRFVKDCPDIVIGKINKQHAGKRKFYNSTEKFKKQSESAEFRSFLIEFNLTEERFHSFLNRVYDLSLPRAPFNRTTNYKRENYL